MSRISTSMVENPWTRVAPSGPVPPRGDAGGWQVSRSELKHRVSTNTVATGVHGNEVRSPCLAQQSGRRRAKRKSKSGASSEDRTAAVPSEGDRAEQWALNSESH